MVAFTQIEVNSHTVGTQAGEPCFETAFKCIWRRIDSAVAVESPLRSYFTYDFGSHKVGVEPPPRPRKSIPVKRHPAPVYQKQQHPILQPVIPHQQQFAYQSQPQFRQHQRQQFVQVPVHAQYPVQYAQYAAPPFILQPVQQQFVASAPLQPFTRRNRCNLNKSLKYHACHQQQHCMRNLWTSTK